MWLATVKADIEESEKHLRRLKPPRQTHFWNAGTCQRSMVAANSESFYNRHLSRCSFKCRPSRIHPSQSGSTSVTRTPTLCQFKLSDRAALKRVEIHADFILFFSNCWKKGQKKCSALCWLGNHRNTPRIKVLRDYGQKYKICNSIISFNKKKKVWLQKLPEHLTYANSFYTFSNNYPPPPPSPPPPP